MARIPEIGDDPFASGLSGSDTSSAWGDLFGTPSGSSMSAAGQLIGGVSDFMSGSATGHKLKDAARRVDNMTAIRLMQLQRQGTLVQGAAEAEIGASGGTVGGSAAEILRANTEQLALAHGIMQQQGSEQSAELRARASASFMSGWGGLIKGVVGAAATIATA